MAATDYADLILRWRAHSGINQAELARRIGISRSSLCDIENRNNNPSPSTLDALAREFSSGNLSVFFAGPPAKKKRKAA